MKRIIYIAAITAIIFSCGITIVSATDWPNGLDRDGVFVFFGEIISYDETDDDMIIKDVIVLPTQKIKGDVKTDIEQAYEFADLVGEIRKGFIPVKGETYLMIYAAEIGYSPYLLVFRVTSTDTKTLNIIGNRYEVSVQELLNDGTLERAEAERLARRDAARSQASDINQPTALPSSSDSSQAPASVTQTDETNYWKYGAISATVAVIIIGLVIYLRKKRK